MPGRRALVAGSAGGIGREHVDTERKVRAVILQTADREERNRLVLQDGSHPLGTDELVGVRVVRRICDRNRCPVAPHYVITHPPLTSRLAPLM